MARTYNGETLSVTSTTVPVQLTPSKYTKTVPNPAKATITVEGGPIRFYCHPTALADVTSGAGHPLYDGDEVDLEGSEIANFAAVKTTGTSGTIVATYREA